MNFRFLSFRRSKKHPSDRDEAGWIVKEDDGLTEEESHELAALRSEKAGFDESYKKSAAAWSLLDNISPELAFESTGSREDRFILLRPVYRELAVAAMLVLSVLAIWSVANRKHFDSELYFTETRSTIEPWTQRLPDGSMVRLNANTKVEVSFTPAYRRVKLLQGEAHFSVAKVPERPFRVFAGDVRVQAVGTAFNVRLSEDEVDVLVTEGIVDVEPGISNGLQNAGTDTFTGDNPKSQNLVGSGQRATVLRYSEDPQLELAISAADSEIIEASLSWQKSLLTFGGDSLDEIAATFEQKTGVKMIVADAELHELRIGGQFPSENVKGFLQVLKSGYGIQWSEKSDGTFVIGESN